MALKLRRPDPPRFVMHPEGWDGEDGVVQRALPIDREARMEDLDLRDLDSLAYHHGERVLRNPALRTRGFANMKEAYEEPSPERAAELRKAFREVQPSPHALFVKSIVHRVIDATLEREERHLHLLYFGTDSMLSLAAELETVEEP